MRGNIPIPELPLGEEIWLCVLVTSARLEKTKQGKPYIDATARNSSGTIKLRIWSETIEQGPALNPGLWGVIGRVETYQDTRQFVVKEYRPITLGKYREQMGADPILPKAFTFDIETLALTGFRDRIRHKLKKDLLLGDMKIEQMQRYLESQEEEIERCYKLGSLSAASGRVLCAAVHIGPKAGIEIEGLEDAGTEYVFGISESGEERGEDETLDAFINLMLECDLETDEIAGHNIINFDLPFVFQRCLVYGIQIPKIKLGEYNVRGVYDTMHKWWLGSKKTVSLDDVAWALGIESSKSEEVEGSQVYDLYQAGRLAEIREYNLKDVRVSRKIYERMVAVFGR